MENYYDYSEHALYCLLITCAGCLLIVLWVFLSLFKGLGMWDWVNPKQKKGKIKYDYSFLFLSKRAVEKSRTICVSNSVVEKIKLFLPVISDETSISDYVDNVLLHHLGQYKDEINELYNKKHQEFINQDKEE